MTLPEALALPYGKAAHECLSRMYLAAGLDPAEITADDVEAEARWMAYLAAQSETPPGEGGAA